MAEIASAYVSLIPSFKGGSAAIRKEIDGAAGAAGKSGGAKAGKGFGGGFIAGMGPVGAAIGAAFAAPAVIGGLNSLADRASDLNETVNKSTVIFGKNAGAIDKWAKGAAVSMGLSRQQALEVAAGFGDMFSQIGFTGDQAAKMSKQVVQMSADLGSFNNLPTAEVTDMISAAFRGEYDSLQRVIPNINAARVETEALAKTGKKSAKELTAQEKAAATLAIVQKDGARAMGDFAKTSDGAANKAKIQAARLEDLKTRAGGALLPVKSLALDGFGALITGAEKMGPTLSGVGASIKGAFASPAVQGGITTLKTGFDGLLYGFQHGEVATDGFAGKMMQLGKWIRESVIPAVMGVVNSVRGFVAVALPIVQSFVAGMMARIRPLMPQIKAIFSTIGQIIVQVMGLVRAIIQRVTTVIAAIWSRWGSNIMDFAAKIFKAVLNIIQGALKVIQGIIKTVTSIIRGDWSGAWSGIKQIVSGAWQAIKGIVSGALTVLGGVIRGGGTLLKNAMSSVGDKINDALSGLAGRLADKGRQLIQGLIDGILGKIEDVKRAAGRVAQAVKDFFPGSPVKDGPLTSWNKGGAGKRLGDMLADGLTSSQRTVAAASRGMAASVATPTGSVLAAGSGAGRLDLSEATLYRLAAVLQGAPLQAKVSAGSFDAAMAVSL